MKRIDSINARPNLFGIGKSGFHDNADLAGQDATYLTPDWLNMIQEEICNLLEKNKIKIDPTKKDQLYDLLATYPYVQALEIAVEERFIAEAALSKKARDELQAQITALLNYVTYPRIVASGVFLYSGGENGGNVTMLSSSDGWASGGKNITAPSIYNLTDRNIGIYMTPEGANEACYFNRTETTITPFVFNRSGQNRIGYEGQVSFQVVQHKNPNSVSSDGDYAVGSYTFILQPNESKIFTLMAAGGGGGASRKDDGSTYALSSGQNGTDIQLKVNGDAIAIVHAGSGGNQGIWKDDGTFTNGAAGPGGTVEIIGVFQSKTITEGNIGGATIDNISGGASVSSIGSFGAGGKGNKGVYTDNGDGLGAGGGSGAVLVAEYKNRSTSNQTITLVVGKGGAGGTKGGFDSDVEGTKGSDGFARVASA